MMQRYATYRDAISSLAASIKQNSSFDDAAHQLAGLYLEYILHTKHNLDGTFNVYNCPKLGELVTDG